MREHKFVLLLSGWAEDSARCCLHFFCLCSRSCEAQSGLFVSIFVCYFRWKL